MVKKELISKVIEVEEIQITCGKPDPNCERCHGVGVWHGLHCPCKMSFGPAKTKQVRMIAVESGKGVSIGLEENNERRKMLNKLEVEKLINSMNREELQTTQYMIETRWNFLISETKKQFSVGNKVQFEHGGKIIVGTVVGFTPKYVKVDVKKDGELPHLYRVSPTWLKKVSEQ